MKKTLLLFLLSAVMLISGACATTQGLRTEAVSSSGVSGSINLVLFGCRYLDDPETVAFLDRDNDAYTFEPFSAAFNYKTVKGLSPEAALEKAGEFIRCHTSFYSERLSSILDDRGNVIGYELRPLYLPLTYGVDDILITDYRIKGDKVVVRIKLQPSVENMISGGPGSRMR